MPRPHRPGRPHWRCTACGAPYPCGSGRLALLAQYGDDRLSLAIHLAARMLDAARDLELLGHCADMPALHPRFVGWLERRTGTPDRESPPAAD
ncbi:MAG TPA: hypothetical protein VGD43_05725 [Micromonospora sp.]